MPRRQRFFPIVLFPAGLTAAGQRATPQTRNAHPSGTPRPGRDHRRASHGRARIAEGRRLSREIARQLGVDVHTAHADVMAELAALRETAVAEATELRSLELERLDGITSGLWPQVHRVARRRSWLQFAFPSAARDCWGSMSPLPPGPNLAAR